MNKTFTKILVLILIAVTSFTACTKDTQAITVANLVGTYVLVSQTEKVTGHPEIDVTTEYHDPCELDDQTILRSDFSATLVDAGTKCSTVDSWTVNWSLDGNVLIIDGVEYNIKSLSQSTLVLEELGAQNNIVITTTYTYRRY
ncbi:MULTISPECIES: lipocalin family protein [Niastella]|uniref:Lipocalin family protein n=1 Tax=Niastella soli TaxID=2821487 RepID=A0ABS3YMK2_9BACT|nr:lipocalin family protein [Niastella soli]MBO9199124.1 lipocalin family protein [Niastella soli]